MLTLALIGLVGGLITGVSPCVLPMLPIIFIAGGQDAGDEAKAVSRTRPLKIILGIITSFSIIALLGSALISALGLPDDTLRYAGFVVLLLVGLGMLFPPLGHLIEKPFYRLPKVSNSDSGPYLLGLGLGTLYVPCAGPVLAAITVAGATGQIGVKTIVLTITFAIGAAIPLLIFATAGQNIRKRIAQYRSRDRQFRIISGVVLIALAIALAFNLTDVIQRNLPAYTSGIEQKVADSKAVQGALDPLATDVNKDLSKCTPGDSKLATCGVAPPFAGITKWYNTPNDQPLSLAKDLRGKVVLLDFWAYSCINCQRNQPYLNAWYKAYKDAGLEIVGVQSPEFSFEKNPNNVQSAINREDISYPVALDTNLGTWTNYRNRYWPAKYLIDSSGKVRAIKFGEGDYDTTESLIRSLLQEANPGVKLPAPTSKGVKTDAAGKDITPETYLAYSKETNYQGQPQFALGKETAYELSEQQADDTYSFGGKWTVQTLDSKAGTGASVKISIKARKVYNVVGGHGTITVHEDGKPDRIVRIDGDPNAYQVLDQSSAERRTLTLDYSAGLDVFTFSFT